MPTDHAICGACREPKPLAAFEMHGPSRRSVCRQCRQAARRRKRVSADPPRVLPTPAERVAITNSFALWFGPVDRAAPLGPSP